jgi:hypothetical protein
MQVGLWTGVAGWPIIEELAGMREISGPGAIYKVVWRGLALVRIARAAQGENRHVEEEPELRPLPPPPRCRGIPLGDGNYTGCAYGYADLAPFTGPRDCPVCNGSGFEGHIETTLPHSDFGDPECCGCLNGVIRGDQADIVCNECGAALRTVPAANVGLGRH